MKKVGNAEIEKVVKELQERDGVCSPQAFVEEARKEDSHIHGLFDWDDSTAAEKWRVHQARTIIGRVRVLLNKQETPAFVHVIITQDDGTQHEGYAGIEMAMNDAELRGQVFAEAQNGLKGWQSRLAAFTEAAGAVQLLGEAIESLVIEGNNL